MAEESQVLDLSELNFVYPTTLLPLTMLLVRNNYAVKLPRNSNVQSYIEVVTNAARFDCQSWKKSYLPLVPLPRNQDEVISILQTIYRIHDNGRSCGGEDAFKYLIGELVENIYEHSEFSSSWVMAQAYERGGHMDICFFDDGITINGCFRKHGMGYERDSEAIRGAIEGVTTKGEGRGYGLNSNVAIFTTGMKGAIFIVSGQGAVEIQRDSFIEYDLEKTYELPGTLITVRIPYPARVVNIYDYLEK